MKPIDEIYRLFEEAERVYSKDKKLADRYVEHARRIAMALNIKMPRELKRKFCPHCYSFLVPGKNLRVRINKNKIVYQCLECKKYWRMPLQ